MSARQRVTGDGRGESPTAASEGGPCPSLRVPAIPGGHRDDAFSYMLEQKGLAMLRGSPAADREYAALICEALDDDQSLDELVDDVAEGTGLDWEMTMFVIWSAVVCYRPEHVDIVLPPETTDRPVRTSAKG